ncbi:MAG: hypothetical protein ACRCSU_08255 [Paracoccaceae bacterium]
MIRSALALFLLTACASPAPEFMGAQEIRITRGGRDFAVFRQGNRAEAIRLGYATLPERQGMVAMLVSVMAEATGCTPIPGTVEGDTSEIRARLRCPKGRA